jgi:hypothetical protein
VDGCVFPPLDATASVSRWELAPAQPLKSDNAEIGHLVVSNSGEPAAHELDKSKLCTVRTKSRQRTYRPYGYWKIPRYCVSAIRINKRFFGKFLGVVG